jgi:hypothetical protein
MQLNPLSLVGSVSLQPIPKTCIRIQARQTHQRCRSSDDEHPWPWSQSQRLLVPGLYNAASASRSSIAERYMVRACVRCSPCPLVLRRSSRGFSRQTAHLGKTARAVVSVMRHTHRDTPQTGRLKKISLSILSGVDDEREPNPQHRRLNCRQAREMTSGAA